MDILETFLLLCAAGGAGGLFGWFVIYPFINWLFDQRYGK